MLTQCGREQYCYDPFIIFLLCLLNDSITGIYSEVGVPNSLRMLTIGLAKSIHLSSPMMKLDNNHFSTYYFFYILFLTQFFLFQIYFLLFSIIENIPIFFFSTLLFYLICEIFGDPFVLKEYGLRVECCCKERGICSKFTVVRCESFSIGEDGVPARAPMLKSASDRVSQIVRYLTQCYSLVFIWDK